MFLNLLTKWKKSENVLKYLLFAFIIVIALLEGFRAFIHNLTTRVGWWMYILGIATAMIVLYVLFQNNIDVISILNKFFTKDLFEYLEKFKFK